MAQQAEKSTSHLGFFVAVLAVAVVCWGAWRFVGNSYFTTQQQAQTAAENPGKPHPPKDRESRSGDAASTQPTSASAENK